MNNGHNSMDQIDEWFKKLGEGGYWYQDMQDGGERMSDWPASEGGNIKCTIGGSSAKRDLFDEEEEEVEGLVKRDSEEMLEKREAGHEHMHRHARVHRRGVKEVI